ncbi:TIGR03885 family FMN-dependent LLM class oxidoreductase [Mucilaginibacter aquatilis]|uniref:TIGR03885 family FMN-dependent LLM class oxidoreductase n=1 Tax=Mucilaginibacter aquatilis TaxID=1517760 RepID=A0A6I4IR69_9SPHI|nr:TIGR03885 family FMN-dependent LLM class oxidoreductase [Mucilaginibacter aquatilis]MVN92963.1 TIGR03885 family FMN-dependent LLM class oxidoreductase [Mucilaginibacter aquatilis]
MRIGYQASHEQFSPGSLLRLAKLAEEAGFNFINSSDHFKPWNENQGHSGFSFAWLGAAMQSTSLPYSMVCAPGQRYHPAIVAQAIATLTEMFPGRLEVALGSGEAINEQVTGDTWPAKPERNQRLLECAQIIKRLLRGETINHDGVVKVRDARLYTLPKVQPPLYCAALSPETAAWAGRWADGLLTAHQPIEHLNKVISAFRNNGGKAKPIILKVQLSYASTEQQALTGACEQWSTNIFDSHVLSDTRTPADFEQLALNVQPQDMYEHVHISSSKEEFVKIIRCYSELDVSDLVLHNVNLGQERFIEDFGKYVIPEVKECFKLENLSNAKH